MQLESPVATPDLPAPLPDLPAALPDSPAALPVLIEFSALSAETSSVLYKSSVVTPQVPAVLPRATSFPSDIPAVASHTFAVLPGSLVVPVSILRPYNTP